MIIQVSPCYVDMNSEIGGVANVIRQICLGLHENKMKTILICSNTELGKTVAQPAVIKFSEYLTIYVIKQNKNPLLGGGKLVRKILTSINDISLIHIHTCFSTLCDLSLQYAVKNTIPCVFTPHGKFSPAMFANKQYIKNLYFKWNLQKYLNKINEIVACSPDEKRYINQLGINNKISHIYNGYSEFVKTALSEQIQKITTFPYLLFLGYLDTRKQPDLLIKAFSQSQSSKKFKLILAGPDSYNLLNSLKKLISSLNLEDKVIFSGRVSGYDKWYLLENSMGLFLPSTGEGWPVVIAEAIGAKVPVVISKACNFSDVTKYGVGIEMEDFNVNKWADAIDSICFDKEIRNVFINNLNNISKYFTWTNITKQWINKYISIINETTVK